MPRYRISLATLHARKAGVWWMGVEEAQRSRHRKRRGATLDNPQSHLQPPSDTRSTWPL